MAQTILICGYGPGISSAVARKFASEGFAVALVARRQDKLDAGVAALRDAGATTQGFVCDLGDAAAIQQLVADVRAQLGPIHTIHWNAYTAPAGDLTTTDVASLRSSFDVGVVGAVAVLQAALPDLRATSGALLITGSGFAAYSDQVDQMVIDWRAMDLAVVKAAQHKLIGLLHHKLKPEGIYVGSVVVLGPVKGTAFSPTQGIEPDAIADAFWQLATRRSDIRVDIH